MMVHMDVSGTYLRLEATVVEHLANVRVSLLPIPPCR